MMVLTALLLMGIFASIASLFLKKSTANGLNLRYLLVNPFLYLGGGLYVLSALLNLYLLKRLPYSVVIPLGSLTYIWTLIIAHRYLHETVTRQKWIGVIFILAGVALLSLPSALP